MVQLQVLHLLFFKNLKGLMNKSNNQMMHM